ncbi:hypothetical protein DL93DRAFT_2085829 [Clavulina sp. PMI_390]|nr:hypothetical protein DL93DRAFT_2085829 [Clavulina sp. PMI_390]
MGWFSWLFRKKRSGNYEEILDSLAISISNRQGRLTELALRERRAALWATIYTLACWAIYTFVWYLNLMPRYFSERTRSNIELERLAHLAPVIIGPIAALFLRRIIQYWYRRKGAAEEATLKKLLAKQRTIIEEIKRETNYYSTKNLLERYDQKPASIPQTPKNPRSSINPQTQLRQRPRQSGHPDLPTISTPDGNATQQPPATPNPGSGPQTLRAPLSDMMSPQFPATPPAQPQRQWFDKVADALLGVDEANSSGLDPAKSRYALICGRCSAHNGLVLESLWEDTQYVCPKCGFFNPSPRSLRNRSSPSPSPDGRSSLRRLSDISSLDERTGRLPKPDFLGVAGGSTVDESSPSRSRASDERGSLTPEHAPRSVLGMDVTPDTGASMDTHPEPQSAPTQEGDVSVMSVDE